jgi:anti-sigma factor RsiW
MNCAQARELLAGLLYGDLDTAQAAAVEAHRAGCPACGKEYASLQHLRRALNAVVAPPVVPVNLPRLYVDTARLQQRQVRRWRRAAVALLGAAAVMLAVVGLKLELRVEAHQLVVRWGELKETATQPEPLPPQHADKVDAPPAPAVSADEWQRMRDLIHALAADIAQSNSTRRQEFDNLEVRLDSLQMRSQQRDQVVAALFTAQFGPHDKKGEKP